MLPDGKICLSTYILSAMLPVTHMYKKILKIQMPKLTELGNLKITWVPYGTPLQLKLCTPPTNIAGVFKSKSLFGSNERKTLGSNKNPPFPRWEEVNI